MTQVNIQKEMLDTLTGLKQEVGHLKQDIHYILEYLEDTRLTAEEKKLLDKSIANVKMGNKSSFISQEDLKKKLGF